MVPYCEEEKKLDYSHDYVYFPTNKRDKNIIGIILHLLNISLRFSPLSLTYHKQSQQCDKNRKILRK